MRNGLFASEAERASWARAPNSPWPARAGARNAGSSKEGAGAGWLTEWEGQQPGKKRAFIP